VKNSSVVKVGFVAKTAAAKLYVGINEQAGV
jgi:hypothetical protein